MTQPDRVRRTSTTPSVDGSSTFSSRSSLGQYPAGAPSAFTAINPPNMALAYDNDLTQGSRARNVSGASTATGYSLADPYNRPQRDSSLPPNVNLAHNNSITSNRSTTNAAPNQAYARPDASPYMRSIDDSPGSMYDSIFENIMANSSSTSLPHPQGQPVKSGLPQAPADREDAESPPPEYSTYAPHDPTPSSAARAYTSGSKNRSGVPALPEIVRDVGGLRLFDGPSEDGSGSAGRLSQRTETPGAAHVSPSHHSSRQHSYEDELRGKPLRLVIIPQSSSLLALLSL